MKNSPYVTFSNDESMKSEILRRNLNISELDFISIQKWFDLLLLKHEQATSDRDIQLVAEKELETKFNELISSEIETKSYRYILPRLLTYNNIFHDSYLRSLYISKLGALLGDNLIPKLINDKLILYTPEDFMHVTLYLKDHYFVSPNSNLLEDTLKIESVRSILKQASVEIKFETLKNILHMIYQKTFHHDIICFKKILKLVSQKDVGLIDYLKKYQVENGQGCYKIIHEILNLDFSKDIYDDFEIKLQLINFLDSGRSANPSSSWTNKFQELSVYINNKMFLQISQTILKNENCKTYELSYGTVWGDDVAKRFLKSAEWIKKLI